MSRALTLDMPEDLFDRLTRLAHELGKTPEGLVQE